MIIKTPVSLGELVDKISILHIKSINIKNDEKLKLINEELEFLNKTLYDHVDKNEIQSYLDSLIEINSKLWIIEDEKRFCEKEKNFNEKFIKLSRDVHFLNDDRAKIKLEINNHTGSSIKEIKEYTSY